MRKLFVLFVVIGGLIVFGGILEPAIFGIEAVAIAPALLVSLILTWGIDRRIIIIGALCAVVAELIQGLDIGSLAIPFLVAVLMLMLLVRFFQFAPVALMERLRVSQLFGAAVIAFFLLVVMSLSAVFVERVVSPAPLAWRDAAVLALMWQPLLISTIFSVVLSLFYRMIGYFPRGSDYRG